MSTGKHYFIEQNAEGKYTTTATGADRASGVHDTQKEAIEHAKHLNPDDHPDVEPIGHISGVRPDKWRSAD